MRRTGTYCEDCGVELEVVVQGGEEPDPDRPGKWRPSTRAELRCPAAFKAFKAEEAQLMHELATKHRQHLRYVTVTWPPPKPVTTEGAQ